MQKILASIPLDLGDSQSIIDFVKKFKSLNVGLNILILNAGHMDNKKNTYKGWMGITYGS